MKFAFAPEAIPLPGYTIKRAIDRGGFGEVYYGLADSGKEVALKLLQRNQQVELRGVRQCLNLKHPNLVSIFDIRTDAEGDEWVIMEFISGPSLDQVLRSHPQGLPLSEVEQWLAGLAAGVAFLHDRGIVHRDLKPGNVFREHGVVKVGDVGLSKFMTPSRRSAQTESVGTVYYMAPEVSRGKYGRELDVYSLGVMLFEMIVGEVPFNGESIGEILMKHLTELPDLSRLPHAVRPVVARALEKDPTRRTADALQLAREFRAALRGSPVATEIPATHFVDVERLERAQGGASRSTPVRLPDPARSGGSSRPVAEPQSSAPGLWRQFGADLKSNPVLMVAIVVTAIFLVPVLTFSTGRESGVRVSMPGFLVWFAVGYAAYRISKKHQSRSQSRQSRHPRPPQPPRRLNRSRVSSETHPALPATQSLFSPAPSVLHAFDLPGDRPAATESTPRRDAPRQSALRASSWRVRCGELTGAMAGAVFWSLTLSALIGLVQGYVSDIPLASRIFVDWSHAALFTLTTIAGAWAVLVPAKLFEPWKGRGNLFITAPLGGLVGVVAWYLREMLLVELPAESLFSGIFTRIGRWPLVSAETGSTLAGFAVFFAVLFGLRRWWLQAAALRNHRLSVWGVAGTALFAWLLPVAFRFNQP
ncbi:MAG: serine/threonine protein kinase [Planctomycetaceae bacterium]|nr:MAG: serine/threonine protein kinase [Planctomycetaceae bacterium]